jgi:hypothetical protein
VNIKKIISISALITTLTGFVAPSSEAATGANSCTYAAEISAALGFPVKANSDQAGDLNGSISGVKYVENSCTYEAGELKMRVGILLQESGDIFETQRSYALREVARTKGMTPVSKDIGGHKTFSIHVPAAAAMLISYPKATVYVSFAHKVAPTVEDPQDLIRVEAITQLLSTQKFTTNRPNCKALTSAAAATFGSVGTAKSTTDKYQIPINGKRVNTKRQSCVWTTPDGSTLRIGTSPAREFQFALADQSQVDDFAYTDIADAGIPAFTTFDSFFGAKAYAKASDRYAIAVDFDKDSEGPPPGTADQASKAAIAIALKFRADSGLA